MATSSCQDTTVQDAKEQQYLRFHVPSHAMRRAFLDPDNGVSPFANFIGNKKIIKRLAKMCCKAMGKEDHVCQENIAFVGPASCGKTTIARLLADALSLPFLEVETKSVKTLDALLEQIKNKLAEPIEDMEDVDLTLVNFNEDGPGEYMVPPMEIFIDEAHNLSSGVEQGLLKATALNDRTMVTESGARVDMSKVTWVIGTTETGKVFGPFLSRFKRMNLNLYTKEEMAKIIQVSNTDWSMECCRLVAHYAGPVPRLAKAFAKEVRDAADWHESEDWIKLIHEVAGDMDIDEHGMSLQSLSVLKALSRGPVAATRLIYMVRPKCEIEELQRDVMPALIAATDDSPIPMVIITSRGYCITPRGLEELDKRNIKNIGMEAIPESERDVLESMCQLVEEDESEPL